MPLLYIIHTKYNIILFPKIYENLVGKLKEVAQRIQKNNSKLNSFNVDNVKKFRSKQITANNIHYSNICNIFNICKILE